MEVDWNLLMGEAMTQLMKIFIPVLIVLVLNWLTKVWQIIKVKNPDLAKLISYAAEIGYAAAEDYFRNYQGAAGSDKMDFALDRAQDFLASVGAPVINIDVLKDAITQYGMANYKFTWAQSPILELIGKKEETNEPGDADHMCLGDSGDGDHTDCQEHSEQSDGGDQEVSAAED